MGKTKTEGKSYTKVTRFYFRACSPCLYGFVNQQLLSGNDRNGKIMSLCYI